MSLLRKFDIFFVVFLASHIPATVIIGSQCAFPQVSEIAPWAKALLDWHVKTNHDVLVGSNPVWFRSMMTAEVLFQLPCFLLLICGISKARPWARILAIVYGTHAATTLVPVLSEVALGAGRGPHSANLLAMYVPYLIVPLLMVARYAAAPLQPAAGAGKKGKQQ